MLEYLVIPESENNVAYVFDFHFSKVFLDMEREVPDYVRRHAASSYLYVSQGAFTVEFA